MNVLLINPTTAYSLDSEAGDAPEEGTGAYPPLGLLHLQAAVEESGRHRAEVLDANRSDGLAGALRRHRPGGEPFDDGPPALVGITALTPNLVSVLRTAADAKQRWPDARVIVGGPHTELYPRETVALDGIDLVLAGEAELTLPRVADALADDALDDTTIPGLYTPTSSSAQAVSPCPLDLDALPAPDLSRVDALSYQGTAGEENPFATLITSRGCPHNCAFCSTPKGRPRMLSVDAIVDGMARYGRLGVRHIYFLDDTFPTGGERLHALCDAIAARPELPHWSCRTAASGLTVEGLEAMKRAGCRRVQIGVETATDEGLRVLRKSATIERIESTFAATRQVGIPTVAYFMLGLPHEHHPRDVRAMIDFACGLGATYALFNVLTLYPGTELFRRGVERGLVEPDVWQRFAERPTRDFVQPIWDEFMTREELSRLQSEAYRRFYWRPSVVARELLRGGLRHKARAGLKMLLSS